MTPPPPAGPSLADFLGPAEHRFFGHGYRRVHRRLDDIRIVRGPEATEARARASVRYPSDWSAKGAGERLVPHLSSVDALLLGAQLAEILLGHAFGLDAGARSRMWLRDVRLRAGGRPQENLDDLPVHGLVRPAEPAYGTDGLCATAVHSRIGSMDVRCEVQHETGDGYRRDSGQALHPSSEDALAEPYRRYFVEQFRHRDLRVTGVAVDRQAGRVDATVHITPAPGEGHPLSTGLEAAYGPSASMIDAITVTGQLTQVLLYALDGLDREASETLWLRRATLSTRLPLRALDRAFPVHARIEDTRRLAIAGDIWRVCDLGYSFHGITGDFAVAHRLPDRGSR
ncbi:AvrD family protein [Streptomyces pseudovenezuelae]|uniref:AvrD family protein n=1 Tax=Streptomyces pseudovenezuelae TaxID=67350 RepID=A0ABZ1X4J6_9ACTN|nr:AvrD family protein [Streptomyces pseudovenezuelae]